MALNRMSNVSAADWRSQRHVRLSHVFLVEMPIKHFNLCNKITIIIIIIIIIIVYWFISYLISSIDSFITETFEPIKWLAASICGFVAQLDRVAHQREIMASKLVDALTFQASICNCWICVHSFIWGIIAVLGALGTISKHLNKWLPKIDIRNNTRVLSEVTALQAVARVEE